jgi:hypothetical protein
MTDNAVERLAELRQRKGVCRRAVKDEIDVAIGLEDFTDAIAHTRRPAIFAVRGCLIYIRVFQCCPCFWADRRRVIAGKLITLATLPHVGLANRLRADEQMSIRASCDCFQSNKERQSPRLAVALAKAAVRRALVRGRRCMQQDWILLGRNIGSRK